MGVARTKRKYLPDRACRVIYSKSQLNDTGSNCFTCNSRAQHILSVMFVRFWGTRGSIPAPGAHTAIYGGNTSCVEVRTHDGTLIILDCGSGIRELGLHLLRTGRQLERIYLLIG